MNLYIFALLLSCSNAMYSLPIPFNAGIISRSFDHFLEISSGLNDDDAQSMSKVPVYEGGADGPWHTEKDLQNFLQRIKLLG